MAYRLEGRTLNRENPVSNPTAVVEPLASLITPRCRSSLSCINEYLALQTVVEMLTNSLRAIAAWLNASQLRWSWNEQVYQRFERCYGLDTALYKNVPFSSFIGIQTTVQNEHNFIAHYKHTKLHAYSHILLCPLKYALQPVLHYTYTQTDT